MLAIRRCPPLDAELLGLLDRVDRVGAGHRQADRLRSPGLGRPGASGSIGLLSVIRAKPDGYTIAIANPDAIAVFPSLKSPAPYTYEQDLKAVAQVVDLNYVFTVQGSSPINTLTDLVQYAKAQPQPITYGSAGLDTSTNLVAELFADQAGIKIWNRSIAE